MITFKHIPVMLEECLNGLNIKADGVYMDGTVGGGGHSSRIAERLTTGKLIAVDRDTEALAAARKAIESRNPNADVLYVHSNFVNIADILAENNIDGLDGLLLDLGVSSYQFDEPTRGFSYNNDGPLDMRMDRSASLTAAEIVNTYSADRLCEIFWSYGEVKFARACAEAIVRHREYKRYETTGELAETVIGAAPSKARREGHPARQIFQALRIEVNGELDAVKDTVRAAAKVMKSGGRICIITFHSLEDRIVKKEFEKLLKPCTCPSDFPICVCGKVTEYKAISRKPLIATEDELKANPRARSAKVRILEKL